MNHADPTKTELRLAQFTWLAALLSILLPIPVLAGGSGLNVLVVANGTSSNSLALANYYCERRQIPPANLLRVNWPGSPLEWTAADFTNTLLNPLLAAINSRGLSNQIDYVVLSMDLPYRVTSGGSEPNSTTASLFYGFKPDPNPPCSLAPNSDNSYAGSESIFRQNKPTTAGTYSFLAMMLTADSFDAARRLVDAGVNGDATYPTQPVVLAKTSDWARNVRYSEFDNAVLNARVRSSPTMFRTNADAVFGLTNLLGLQTGLSTFDASSNAFVPGAMADSLTSYGGALFDNTGQTTLLGFVAAGAAGSYGTVTEPCNYPQKFPDPMNYFYQARGFSLAESYYQSIGNPYQGLPVGDALAAPFATNASVTWPNLPTNSVLQGVTNLAVHVATASTRSPIQQVDLFVDGTFAQTLTNPAPPAGNRITVVLNGFSRTYTVAAGATLQSVVSGLTASLNSTSYKNNTQVQPVAFGDRVELRSTDTSTAGSQLTASVSTAIGTGSALQTYAFVSRSNFADTTASASRQYLFGGTTVNGTILQALITKTNGSSYTIAVTNTSGMNLGSHVGTFGAAINNTAGLQGADGLMVEDFIDIGTQAQFDLRARSPGIGSASIQVTISDVGAIVIQPAGLQSLNENLTDLQPRNHLFVTTGTTNLTLSFPFSSTNLADGYHELTAVAYEGTHVRTQTRATIPTIVQNTALSGTLTLVGADALTAVETNFSVHVTANQGNISLIELFTTGGRLAATTNQSSAAFAVSGQLLGAGLHPFNAVITAMGGQQYRTSTTFVRLAGRETEIAANVLWNLQPLLGWAGVTGRRYDISSSDDLTLAFGLRDTVTASNSLLNLWADPALSPTQTQRFYRVGVSQ